jgi:hypothetical protein
VGGKEAGVTDDKGELVYLYRQSPPKGAELAVAKAGYGAYRATRRFEAGEVVEVALNRQAVVTIKALTDEYGRATGLAGLSVALDGKPLGKTDAQGALHLHLPRRARQEGRSIALAAPGHIPAAWKTTVSLDGPVSVQHYFYPTTPKPIRIGIYRVVRQHSGRRPERCRRADRAVARRASLQVPGLPRGAGREAPGRDQAAQARDRAASRPRAGRTRRCAGRWT